MGSRRDQTSTDLATEESVEKIRMEIPSHPRFVSIMRDFVYRISLQHGFTASGAFDMKIVTGEALSNIIRHAYHGENNRPIYIELQFHKSYLELQFRDQGDQKRIAESDMRDLTDYREKGVGVYLIEKLTDYHFYDQSGAKGTLLTVKRRIA